MNLRDVTNALNPLKTQFDGDGHVFSFREADAYEYAQNLAKKWMSLPKSERPRGWSRGRLPTGELFIRIRLH